MDPMLMLLGALLLNGRRAPSSAAPATNGTTNGNGHAVQMVQLHAGHSYKFVGTLASDAPPRRQIRELLKLVDARDVQIRSEALSFVAKMPLDVPFHPGTVHPQAPWLTLQSVEEITPEGRRAAPPRKPAKRRTRK